MPKKTGTASEFMLVTLAADPSLEWSVRELMEKAGDSWTEANVYNTLTRLHAAGKLKRAKDGHAVWWSIAGAQEPDPAPVVVDEVDVVPEAADAPVPSDGPTAAGFVLDLLARHPDYEMSVTDIWEEADRKWKRQTMANTLDRLVEKGSVVRVKDGGSVWFSIAG
jgi:predicted transcriptional regulator